MSAVTSRLHKSFETADIPRCRFVLKMAMTRLSPDSLTLNPLLHKNRLYAPENRDLSFQNLKWSTIGYSRQEMQHLASRIVAMTAKLRSLDSRWTERLSPVCSVKINHESAVEKTCDVSCRCITNGDSTIAPPRVVFNNGRLIADVTCRRLPNDAWTKRRSMTGSAPVTPRIQGILPVSTAH